MSLDLATRFVYRLTTSSLVRARLRSMWRPQSSAPPPRGVPGGPGSPRTYYDVLGVPPDASQADIKQRFYELSRQFHPDKNRAASDQDTVHRKYADISEAYETLRTATNRSQYDRLLVRRQEGARRVSPSVFHNYERLRKDALGIKPRAGKEQTKRQKMVAEFMQAWRVDGERQARQERDKERVSQESYRESFRYFVTYALIAKFTILAFVYYHRHRFFLDERTLRVVHSVSSDRKAKH